MAGEELLSVIAGKKIMMLFSRIWANVPKG